MTRIHELRNPTTHPTVLTVREALARLDDGRLRPASDSTGVTEWSDHRKHVLLDSVLRGWPIGTFLVAREPDGRHVLLDGQRRLAALGEFVRGELLVDGRLAPQAVVLRESDGRAYPDLPRGLREAVDEYPLVFLELDGLPPGELRTALLRLNSEDQLPESGRRLVASGSFGEQVRRLVVRAADWGLAEERVGFGNVGLAYEDVISRVLVSVEAGSIRAAAMGSEQLNVRLRSGNAVTQATRDEVAEALKELLSLPALDVPAVRFTKPTLLSWLLVMVRARRALGPGAEHHLGYLMEWLEPERRRRAAQLNPGAPPPLRAGFRDIPHSALLERFNEVAAVGAHTAESTVLRDAITWLFLVATGGAPSRKTPPVPDVIRMYEVLTSVGAGPFTEDRVDQLLWADGVLGAWGEWG
ncbi:DUF262 domain-containing protein [Streptomyces millisiae]|uniref:DUF262 domain-containing protein n=1 Tax=Streptomyces millisiae TaxID=3075542 RepID=A0ABU2LLG6_9ACTN|nr:DUF262 domain-containing protein [Streptomyces sp. DSM 44918]MDT0318428.1 DUF262 domain-containing protein [Streptomyces sp. DSM 44918]